MKKAAILDSFVWILTFVVVISAWHGLLRTHFFQFQRNWFMIGVGDSIATLFCGSLWVLLRAALRKLLPETSSLAVRILLTIVATFLPIIITFWVVVGVVHLVCSNIVYSLTSILAGLVWGVPSEIGFLPRMKTGVTA